MSASDSCQGAGEGFGRVDRGGGARWTRRRRCSVCGKDLKLTGSGRIPRHKPADAEWDEESYAQAADEVNDGSPTDIDIEDLDPKLLERAQRFAYLNGFPYPPSVGDFDRYYEWTTNGRRKRVRW